MEEMIIKGKSVGTSVFVHNSMPAFVPWIAVLVSRISINKASTDRYDKTEFAFFFIVSPLEILCESVK